MLLNHLPPQGQLGGHFPRFNGKAPRQQGKCPHLLVGRDVYEPLRNPALEEGTGLGM